jgi:hypothetical protein
MLTRVPLVPLAVAAVFLSASAAMAQVPPPPETSQSQTGKLPPDSAAPPGPVPAPLPPANVSFDYGPSLHGFADVGLKNFYATPRGLLVTDKGETVQVLDGLVLDWARPSETFSDFAMAAGTWTDFNPGYSSGNKNAVNEVDLFVGMTGTFFKDFKAGAQYVVFTSPQRAFHDENNVELSLAFDDSAYLKPLSIQPYIKYFRAVSGSSTVVTGQKGDTYDVEIGAVPKLDLHPYAIPVILTAPSWFTVGPTNYWGGTSNFGVVSTGLKATYPLGIIPSNYGHWYLDAGIQYYHELNPQLLLAQTFVGTAQPGTNEHKNFFVWLVGFGLGF